MPDFEHHAPQMASSGDILARSLARSDEWHLAPTTLEGRTHVVEVSGRSRECLTSDGHELVACTLGLTDKERTSSLADVGNAQTDHLRLMELLRPDHRVMKVPFRASSTSIRDEAERDAHQLTEKVGGRLVPLQPIT